MTFKKLFDITLYETGNFEINQDWEVPIPGFFILASKRKLKSITELSHKESHELIDILRKTRKAMRIVLKISEISLFQEEKTGFNFHIWILPHYNWMDKLGTNSLKEILKYAQENMSSDKNIKSVEEAAKKVKEYLNRKNFN